MVIRKGGSYGSESDLDPAWPSFVTDAALAAHIEHHGDQPCTLTGGDLLATLGGGAPRGVSPRAYPVDVLEVRIDGEDGPVRLAVAHVVARRPLWAGQFAAAMNAAYVDGLYLGPRSHPNDGLVDVTTGSLGWQQRLLARGRARTGSHLPHPDLKMVRRGSVELSFDRPTPITLDGVLVGRTETAQITVREDAGLVVV